MVTNDGCADSDGDGTITDTDRNNAEAASTLNVYNGNIYGTVTTTSYNNSAGYYVTINHGDGFSTSYLHMTHYIVSEGQRVSAGQVIGYVGSTGVSTGPHLHFTIYYNGATVNPANYINFY